MTFYYIISAVGTLAAIINFTLAGRTARGRSIWPCGSPRGS
ncbi:MAG TPA: hypothetical protein VF916_02830 [Ktedonobacterales bacterium]